MSTVLLAVSVLILLLAPFVSGGMIGELTEQNLAILYSIRIPRIATAFLAGGGLAACGVLCQCLFRNPLATPYTLGTAAGSSLGAVIALSSGFYFSFWIFDSTLLCGYIGALASMATVYCFGKKNDSLLLAGIAVGLTFSSLILFAQHFNDFFSSALIVQWLMGRIEAVGMETPLKIFIPLFVGLSYAMGKSAELELLSVGEDFAASRGVDVRSLQLKTYLVLSLVVAAIVSECGPIGFVGIMVPHAVRKIFGGRIIRLIPDSFVAGGVFLVFCDALSRSFAATAIPVGIITAICGGPFFLWILRRR